MNPSLDYLIRKHSLINAFRHEGKADVNAVVSKIIGDEPGLRSQLKVIIPQIIRMVQVVNNMSAIEILQDIQKDHPEVLEKPLANTEERMLHPLENAEEGKVVTRFPPEPNGYPHIGHAKAAIIDYTYAKMYGGSMILRFDDTNPSKEKLEYYDAIRDGLTWLGIKPDLEKNTSDDMDILYFYAEKLVSEGYAYVCSCRSEIVKRNRYEEMECSCRSQSVSEHLSRWKNMFTTFKPNEAVLRLRGNMKSLNTVMRDPALFRIMDEKHPLKGDKYRVWPLYDFVAPIEDSKDGVTHALRTKEYELRDELYYYILKILNLRAPKLIEFARLEIKGSTVSKRRLQPLVQGGLVEGWDDPRLPTLLALRRRGFLPESIRAFVISLGVSKAESEPDFSILESINRKILDASTKRLFFVPDPVILEVRDAPKTKVSLRYHPNKDLGQREINTSNIFYIPKADSERLKENDELRLIGLYNVRIESSNSSGIISKYIDDEIKDEVLKVQWVTNDNVEFSVLVAGQLMMGDEFNKDSLKIVKGLGEIACKGLSPDDIIQFVRFGFCRIDKSGLAIFTHK